MRIKKWLLLSAACLAFNATPTFGELLAAKAASFQVRSLSC